MKALSPGQFSSARATWREAAVLLLASWLVPVLIHLLPALGHRENGVYLIPAFWAAFVAVYFYGSALGVVVALVTPLINLMLTGLPAAGWVGPMSLELVAYTLTCAWLLRRWGTLWLIAPFAYIPAKAFALAIVGAEYVMRWLPRGTHDWKKFVRPAEFARWLRTAGIDTQQLVGATYDPINGEWRESHSLDVNYMILGIKL